MGLNAPLLGSVNRAKVAANMAGIPTEVLTGENIKGSGSKVETETNNEKGSSNTIKTIAVSIFAAVSFAAAAAAMVTVPAMAVFLAGGVCCLNAPTVLHRQFSIESLPKLREKLGELMEKVDAFTETVDIMSDTVDRLQNELDDLEVTEYELKNIVKDQDCNVSELVKIVKENEEILDAMKYNLRTVFAAEVMKITLRSDKDGDMKIDLKEGYTLALRLKIHLNTYGINLDSEMFYSMLEQDNSIENIVKFCAEVLYPDTMMNDDMDPDNDSSSLETESSGGAAVASAKGKKLSASTGFASFCKALGNLDDAEIQRVVDNVQFSLVEKLGMISIDDKFSQGSVEKARGRKMTIFPAKMANKRQSRMKTLVESTNRRCTAIQKRGNKVRG